MYPFVLLYLYCVSLGTAVAVLCIPWYCSSYTVIPLNCSSCTVFPSVLCTPPYCTICTLYPSVLLNLYCVSLCTSVSALGIPLYCLPLRTVLSVLCIPLYCSTCIVYPSARAAVQLYQRKIFLFLLSPSIVELKFAKNIFKYLNNFTNFRIHFIGFNYDVLKHLQLIYYYF